MLLQRTVAAANKVKLKKLVCTLVWTITQASIYSIPPFSPYNEKHPFLPICLLYVNLIFENESTV